MTIRIVLFSPVAATVLLLAPTAAHLNEHIDSNTASDHVRKLKESSREPLDLRFNVSDLPPSVQAKLPSAQNVKDLYGLEPVILGLDRCEDFRETYAPEDRFIAMAGLYNTGTNLLFETLTDNCVIPGREESYAKYGWGGEFADGILSTVRWGKHGPPSLQSSPRHIFAKYEGMMDYTKYDFMPIVIVKDPIFWMASMCKRWYDVTSLVGGQKLYERCPYLALDEKGTPIPVRGRLAPWDDEFEYNSLVDMWNEFYQAYIDYETPRLIVRYEDLLFHGETVTKQICSCAGGTVKNFVPFQQSTKMHVPDKDGQSHGWIDSAILYGNPDERNNVFQVDRDRVFAEKHLDDGLMNLLNYQLPSTATTGKAETNQGENQHQTTMADELHKKNQVESPHQTSQVEYTYDQNQVENPQQTSQLENPHQTSQVENSHQTSQVENSHQTSQVENPLQTSQLENPHQTSQMETPHQASQVEIPHILWFVAPKETLSEIFFHSVVSTIDAYKETWNEPEAEVNVLSHEHCLTLVSDVMPELEDVFSSDDDAARREDVCQLAALYKHGGYAFAIHVETEKPFVPKEGVPFVASVACNDRQNHGPSSCRMSKNFKASTPDHALVKLALDAYAATYQESELWEPAAQVQLEMARVYQTELWEQEQQELFPLVEVPLDDFTNAAIKGAKTKKRNRKKPKKNKCDMVIRNTNNPSEAHFAVHEVRAERCSEETEIGPPPANKRRRHFYLFVL